MSIKLVYNVLCLQLIILILMLLWSCFEGVFRCIVIITIFVLFYSSIYSFNYVLCALPQYHLGITELGIGPYIEDEGTGDLRYVQVCYS